MTYEQETPKEEKETSILRKYREVPQGGVLHHRRALPGRPGRGCPDHCGRNHHHVADEVAVGCQQTTFSCRLVCEIGERKSLSFVGVFGADGHQLGDVFVGQTVVDHSTVPACPDQLSVSKKTELMTDGGNRKVAESRQITDAEFVDDVEGMEDPQAGWIGKGREKPCQPLDRPVGHHPLLDEGYRFRVDLVDGTDISCVFVVAHMYIVPEGNVSVNHDVVELHLTGKRFWLTLGEPKEV